MKSVPLRRRLFLLVIAATLPLATVSAWALVLQQQQHRERLERIGLDVARAISATVDSELRRTAAILETLATSLRRHEEIGGLEEQLRRVQSGQPFWRAVFLVGPSGRVLAATAPDGPHSDFEPVLGGADAAAVGSMTALAGGDFAIPVRAKVALDGTGEHALVVALDPQLLQRVLEDSRVPEDWLVSIGDAGGMRAARSHAYARTLGTPFSASLMAMIARAGNESTGVTTNSEGEQVFSAYTRSRETGWITAVGLSVTRVQAAALRSFLTFGGGILLSAAAGLLAALVIARSISRPMAQLRESALRSGHRESVPAPVTDIREIQDVAGALAMSEAERRRFEAEREALLQKEKAARTAAETANRAKDEFLAMLGHELRNPLGAIANAAQMLDLPEAAEAHKTQARAIIARQVSHLSRLTDDLLDAGRALMGKIVLQRVPIDLATVVRNSLATLRTSGRTAGHRVIESLAPAWVEADPIRLDQILGNLVMNAVKYTPSNGTIRVGVGREGDQAVLRVADDGIGIPPELAARVFDIFVQGDRELDRSLGGLGIGLTLVRRLAELHGGSAEVRSDGTGHGSEFIVRLPTIDAPVQTVQARADTACDSRRRILLVEDNADAREALRALLEVAGHQVQVAADGESGLALVLSERPDVVLLDVGLPKMNGYDVARGVRAAGGWVRQPLLIAITGYGQPEDLRLALAAGFDAHLPKPLSLGQLNELLARHTVAVPS